MNNDAVVIVPALDWSELSTNDAITAIMTLLPQLCWLQLNTDSRNSPFNHPLLAVDNLLRIDSERLRELLGGAAPGGSVSIGAEFYFVPLEPRGSRGARGLRWPNTPSSSFWTSRGVDLKGRPYPPSALVSCRLEFTCAFHFLLSFPRRLLIYLRISAPSPPPSPQGICGPLA